MDELNDRFGHTKEVTTGAGTSLVADRLGHAEQNEISGTSACQKYDIHSPLSGGSENDCVENVDDDTPYADQPCYPDVATYAAQPGPDAASGAGIGVLPMQVGIGPNAEPCVRYYK
eukprot:8625324-Karenia_brevis.AAC.1